MNTEDFDLGQLKKAWREMGIAIGMNTSANAPENIGKMSTTLDRIRFRYLAFAAVSLLSAAVFFPMMLNAPFLPEDYRYPLAVAFAVLMLFYVGVDLAMRRNVGKINPAEMSVTEVAEQSRACKRFHLRFVMIGFPLALCWVAFFAWALVQTDFNAIGGIIVGGAIGLFIGIRALRRFMHDYRSLSE